MDSGLLSEESLFGPSLFRGQQLQQNSVLFLIVLYNHHPMRPVARMATVKEAARTANEAFSVGSMSSVLKLSGAFTVLMMCVTLVVESAALRSLIVTFVGCVACFSLATILELSSRSTPV